MKNLLDSLPAGVLVTKRSYLFNNLLLDIEVGRVISIIQGDSRVSKTSMESHLTGSARQEWH